MMMFLSPGNGDAGCSLDDEDGYDCRQSNLYTFDDDEDICSLALGCKYLMMMLMMMKMQVVQLQLVYICIPLPPHRELQSKPVCKSL